MNVVGILLLAGRYLLRTVVGFILFLLLYAGCTVVLTWIPVNTGFEEAQEGVTIYAASNGVHTDIVMPARNAVCNWNGLLPYSDVTAADSTYGYVSIGWGDKGFYIGTPTWADLKTSTALKAAFWLSTSAMHVTWKKDAPPLGEKCKRVTISAEQYRALCAYVKATFQLDAQGKPEYIKAKPYTTHDTFYEAHGRYNLFKTCNVWAGNALRTAGVKVSLWTPFDRCVLYQLPEH